MAFSCSFAGVSLPLATPYLEERLRYIHSPYSFDNLSAWNFLGFGLDSLPTPVLPFNPPLEIGKLYWPTGAVNPAWFHAVVNGSRLNTIRAAVGDPMSAKPLVLSDDRVGHSITAQMYLLPPRPLNQLGIPATDGWLITLSDRRFYDIFRRGVLTQPTSWTDLFAQIAGILGTSITVDTIASAYGTPSAKWVKYYQPTATILDAAAAQVGQQVVYSLDGTISTRNWRTARAAADSQLIGVVAQSGGYLDDSDIGRYVPASVNVCFGYSNNPAVPYVVNNTLVALNIPEYGTSQGVTGTQGTTFADTLFTGANTTAINNYASQAASDWYGWRLSDIDVSIPGIQNFAPTGWEETIEWTYQRRDGEPYADTRIRRGPWDDFPSGTWYAGLTPIPPDWIPSGSGSGSGSGAGCSQAVDSVTIDCNNGIQQIAVPSLTVSVVDNQLVILDCGETVYDLGPCSPVNPSGTTLPVVTKVCPVFETIQYLDWSSQPQSKRVVTGFVLERSLISVALADSVGCTTFDPVDCCSGSGSGSGSTGRCQEECITSCEFCAVMSGIWTLTLPDQRQFDLCHLLNPDDGNHCRFVSDGGAWELRWISADAIWVVINWDTGDLWYIADFAFNCLGDNILTNVSDGTTLDVSPAFDCSTVSYNCSSGTCVAVPGTGGQYATLAACQAACSSGGVSTPCCVQPTPYTLYVHFGGALSTVGTVTLTYDATSTSWNGMASGTCGIGSIRFQCDTATNQWVLLLGPAASSERGSAVTCDPFYWIATGTSHLCPGDYTATVDTTPP